MYLTIQPKNPWEHVLNLLIYNDLVSLFETAETKVITLPGWIKFISLFQVKPGRGKVLLFLEPTGSSPPAPRSPHML